MIEAQGLMADEVNPLRRPLPVDVVSVQSQVVYGTVGNNAAMPALQRLGLLAAAVPTVAFSNTPHYDTLHGGVIPQAWFEGYLADLCARGVMRDARAVLTGYMGSPEQIAALARWLARVDTENPALRVYVDPVIGDDDTGVYVDPLIMAAQREHLLPLAHGLLPNGFELGMLTGLPTETPDETVAAARSLLQGRTEWVVVTSATPRHWKPGQMDVAVVTRDAVDIVSHPHFAVTPKGTGDLFTAVVCGSLLKGMTLSAAVQQAVDQVIAALTLTRDACCVELMLS